MQDEKQLNSPASKKLVINKQVIEPGQDAIVKFEVGRLHSGTRLITNFFVYRSDKPGPIALIMGGVHGDEVNGIEIVRRAIDQDIFKNLIAGSVIAIPVVNVYGFINFSRVVSEGKDVNRYFPGSQRGSMASRVANMIARTVLPDAHFVIDFHTGGDSRYNYPQVRYTKGSLHSLELARHFAPRFILEKPVIRGSLRKMAKDASVPMIIYEGGEALRLDALAIENGLQGLRRVLQALEMKQPVELPKPEHPTFIQKASWLRAPRAGIFAWSKAAGSPVTKGESLGTIANPYGGKTTTVLAHKSGYILAHNNAPIVSQGDALFNIGYGVASPDLPKW